MRSVDVEDMLDRNPFFPFRISLSSGEHMDVTTRHSVAIGHSELLIVLPDDRWKLIPLQQIASVETLRAA